MTGYHRHNRLKSEFSSPIHQKYNRYKTICIKIGCCHLCPPVHEYMAGCPDNSAATPDRPAHGQHARRESRESMRHKSATYHLSLAESHKFWPVNYRVLKGAASHVIANTCITVMWCRGFGSMSATGCSIPVMSMFLEALDSLSHCLQSQPQRFCT